MHLVRMPPGCLPLEVFSLHFTDISPLPMEVCRSVEQNSETFGEQGLISLFSFFAL